MNEILNEYHRNNSIACQTMCGRIFTYILNFGGMYMLCWPLLKLMAVLPLVAYFLRSQFFIANTLTAALLTLVAQLLFTSFALLWYRPLAATMLLLLTFTIAGLFWMPSFGDGMTPDQVDQLYEKYNLA